MIQLRHVRVPQVAGQGIIHPADRLVEARPTPAVALPAEGVVGERRTAEVEGVVAPIAAAVVVEAASISD